MPDPFVPEADAIEQQQDAIPLSEPEDDDLEPAERRPPRLPMDAPEEDVLEQSQPVELDEEFEEREDEDIERRDPH